MWNTVVTKYGDNPRAYFQIFNESNLYTKDDSVSLYGSSRGAGPGDHCCREE